MLPVHFDSRQIGQELPSCHCPHWGYVIEGSMKVVYDGGSEELIRKGDVFYLPAGHMAIVQEDMKMIDFNPSHEFNEVITHVGKMMQGMG